MNPQPQVRSLQDLIAEQQAALKPQQQLIDEQIAANATSGAAQEAGLAATQQKAFKGIEQTAQNKGMFFSGFSPAEQADYTASTYLPALAQLQQTIAANRSNLMGKKADLNLSAFEKATNIRENDIKILNDWNQLTAQQKFNASEAEKDRVFQAQQNANKIAADAANNEQKDTVDQAILKAFAGNNYKPGAETSIGFAENLIPQLMADYGLTKEQAAAKVYTYRKQLYNE